MEVDGFFSIAVEILRVAPIIVGLMLGLRFLFYNEEEWNLDGVFRRIRWGKNWREKIAGGASLPVSPWWTRFVGLVLLGGVIFYSLSVYETGIEDWLLKLP